MRKNTQKSNKKSIIISFLLIFSCIATLYGISEYTSKNKKYSSNISEGMKSFRSKYMR